MSLSAYRSEGVRGGGGRWVAAVVAVTVACSVLGCKKQEPGSANERVTGGAAAAAVAMPAPLPSLGFQEVTPASGIRFRHTIGDDDMDNLIEAVGGGCAMLDYDGDGLLDIYAVTGINMEGVSKGPRPAGEFHNRLFRNLGGCRFEEVTDQAGVRGKGYSMGAAVGDYDGDGDPDLYVLCYGPNLLYRNNGDGTFTEVAEKAGLTDPRAGNGAAFLDYNNDGKLDLYVVNYIEFDPDYKYFYSPDSFPGPLDYAGQPDALYRNNGDGTFTDVAESLGLLEPDGRGMGVTAADFNGDGWVDLYVSNDAGPNRLYYNERGQAFREAGTEMGVAFNQSGDATASMIGELADIDGDGDLDMFVSDDTYGSLYRNDGDLYTDVTLETGVGEPKAQFVTWACGFLDYDNDADADLFLVNGDLHHLFGQEDLLLENDGKGHFTDVSPQRGDYFHQKYIGRGACFGDVDNDGDVDVFTLNLNEEARLLRNDGGNRNNWIMLHLVGTRSNRDAVGARVKLTAGGRTQVGQRRSGGSYLSSSDPRLHFGLGKAEKVDRLEILWPSGVKQVLENLAVRQIHTITEPER